MRETFDHIAYAKTFSGGRTLLRGTREACVEFVLRCGTVDGMSTHVRRVK